MEQLGDIETRKLFTFVNEVVFNSASCWLASGRYRHALHKQHSQSLIRNDAQE